MTKKGVVIAHLSEKYLKKTKESKSYYLLKLNLRQNLTQRYFKLTGQKTLTLKSNQPLYLFCDKNKWGAKLAVGNDYFFEYHKRGKYLILEDWKILGDYLTIKRVLKLILGSH